MKKLITLFIVMFTAGAAMAQNTLVVSQNCDKGVVQLGQQLNGAADYNGHAYVDLGLPSGLKWATCNVGAANPWDYGDYFAWGETVGYGKSDPSNTHNKSYTGGSTVKTYYYWDTYKYCSGTSSETLTKYNYDSDYGVVDNKGTLDLSDDAARVNMGGSWRMPTTAEQQELISNCYWEWTSSYSGKGVGGYIVYKVKSASDKGKVKYGGSSTTTVGSYSLADPHIFLPAAGFRDESVLSSAGLYGNYWSSSLYDGSYPYYAYYLYFSSDDVYWDYDNRDYGRSVRAVEASATRKTIGVKANGCDLYEFQYEYGNQVLINATPEDGYKFTRWSDGNTENPRMITVTGDKTYIAEFERIPIPVECVRLHGLEQTYTSEGEYVYTFVSLMPDFVDAEEILSEEYDILTISYVGEARQFHFQVESFDEEGEPNGDFSQNYWLTDDDIYSGECLKTIEGKALSNALTTTTTTVSFELPSEIRARFSTGDACMHVHFVGFGTMEIKSAYLCKSDIATITTEVNYAKGGTVKGGGVYERNSTATLTAVPNADCSFVQWSDGNTDNPRTITVRGDKTYTAEFKCELECVRLHGLEQTYTSEGEYVYTFVSLMPDFVDAEEILSEEYDILTISYVGEASLFRFQVESFDEEGEPNGDISQIYWLTNDNIYSGECLKTIEGKALSNALTTTTVSFELPSEIRARFSTGDACMHVHFGSFREGTMEIKSAYLCKPKSNIATITTEVNDIAMGTVSGGGSYVYNATATLTATPNEGYTFTRWSDGNTDNPRTITVTQNTTFVAEFELDMQAPTDLMVSDMSDTQIRVSWGVVPQAVRYALYASDGILIDENVTDTTKLITDLEPATHYEFYVKAISENGFYSEASSILKTGTLMSVPVISSVICNDDKNQITWTYNSVPAKFNIYRSATIDGGYTKIGEVDGNVRTFVDGSEFYGRRYYKVSAVAFADNDIAETKIDIWDNSEWQGEGQYGMLAFYNGKELTLLDDNNEGYTEGPNSNDITAYYNDPSYHVIVHAKAEQKNSQIGVALTGNQGALMFDYARYAQVSTSYEYYDLGACTQFDGRTDYKFGFVINNYKSPITVDSLFITNHPEKYTGVAAESEMSAAVESACSNKEFNLISETMSPNQVSLTWSLIHGASSYTLYRSVDSVNFVAIGNNLQGTSYVDESVRPNTKYYYKVYANASEDYSYEQWVYDADATPLYDEKNNGFTLDGNMDKRIDGMLYDTKGKYTAGYIVQGSWAKFSVPFHVDATYKISMYMASGYDYDFGGPITAYLNDEPNADTPIMSVVNQPSNNDWQNYKAYSGVVSFTEGTYDLYFYAGSSLNLMKIVFSPECLRESSVLSVTTLPIEGDKPIELEAGAISSKQVSLKWNMISGASSYTLYRSVDSVNFVAIDNNIQGTSYVDGSVQPNTKYYYKVSASVSADYNYEQWVYDADATPLYDSVGRYGSFTADGNAGKSIDGESYDTGGKYTAGFINYGDWVKFSIPFAVDATYKISMYMAAESSSISAYLNDEANTDTPILSVVDQPSNNEWQNYKAYTGTATFTQGTHDLYLYAGSSLNLMKIDFCLGEILKESSVLSVTTLPAHQGEFYFSSSERSQVYFSAGNLQYQASTDTWRFAEHQYDIVGNDNQYISPDNDKWIDLFGLGTSGYENKYPYLTSTYSGDYVENIAGTMYDWGVNTITNGTGVWRTLTANEWEYILYRRPNASGLFGAASVNGVYGLVLLPDDWMDLQSVSFVKGNVEPSEPENILNNYSVSQWQELENNGAVFLPIAGRRTGTTVQYTETDGRYWSATGTSNVFFGFTGSYPMSSFLPGFVGYDNKSDGFSVRLVQETLATVHTINVVAGENGTVYPNGENIVNHNGTITLTATPAAGYAFVQWSDGNTENPRTVTVTQDSVLIAEFEEVEAYTLTVLSNNAEYGTVTGGGTYRYGEEVVITAIPRENQVSWTGKATLGDGSVVDMNAMYYLRSWSDNGSREKERTITVTRDSLLTASFSRAITLRPNEGMWITQYPNIEYFTSLITLPENVSPLNYQQVTNEIKERFEWEQTQKEKKELYENGDEYVHKLTLLTNDSSRGEVSGAGYYYQDEEAILEATPTVGYAFVQWSDGNTQNPRTVTVTGDRTYTATFAAVYYAITAQSDNVAMGTVSGGGAYAYNSAATLTATPAAGYAFVQWSDGNTQNPRTVTVTGDKAYTAVFGLRSYTLTLKQNFTLMGDVEGGGTYEYNTMAGIFAAPKAGYHFVRWSDGNTDNPRYVKVTGDATYTAEFAVGAAQEESHGATVNNDGVSVTPYETKADFVWPSITGVASYSLIIWADDAQGRKVCTFTFNANGQLTNIDFTQSVKPQGSASVGGLNFTVTGLEPSTTYGYTLDAKDAEDEVIETKHGTFTTMGASGIADITAAGINIYTEGRTIIVENAAEAITVSDALGRVVGKDDAQIVPAETRNFPVPSSGVYVVKIGNRSASVLVR